MEGDSIHSYSFEGRTDEDDRFFQMCSSSSAEENTLLSDDLEENVEEDTEEYRQDDTLLSDDLQENIEDDTKGYCQDHSLYTGSTEHSEGTSSENENPWDVERSELFRQIQHELNGASFDKILCISALYSDVVSKYKITGDAHFFEASQVDEDALTWFPKDSQPLTPLKIYGDGNCLARCASMMAFGYQDNHVEMRTRIVMELALNLDTYLDDEFLKSGHECEDYLPTIYAMYSGNHFRGKHVSKTKLRGILCKEIEEISKPAWYMGVWEIHAVASVIQRKIQSIYPLYGGATVREHLHRMVVPRLSTDVPVENIPTAPTAIMWTSLGGTQKTPKEWKMNHFVVCVPQDAV